MLDQGRAVTEGAATGLAPVGLLPGVDPPALTQMRYPAEGLPMLLTCVQLCPGVYDVVLGQVDAAAQGLPALPRVAPLCAPRAAGSGTCSHICRTWRTPS